MTATRPRPTDEELDAIAEGLAPFNRRLILTGAGFTRPWGGYLTTDIWSLIISDPAVYSCRALNERLHVDFNFESVLADIEGELAGGFSDADRNVMRGAVSRAFQIQQNRIHAKGPGAGEVVRHIIEALHDRHNKVSTCVFTLNQDLLFESFLLRYPNLLGPPGVESAMSRTTATVAPFEPKRFKSIKARTSYIKLHGSMNWRDLGGQVIVLGGAKEAAIRRFDILRMNSAIFRRALMQPDGRLLVIGYGFGDEHINRIIADAVGQGLKLWIADPRDPSSIRATMCEQKGKTSWGGIWKSVVGHSTGSEELFGEDNDGIEFELLRERFWNT